MDHVRSSAKGWRAICAVLGAALWGCAALALARSSARADSMAVEQSLCVELAAPALLGAAPNRRRLFDKSSVETIRQLRARVAALEARPPPSDPTVAQMKQRLGVLERRVNAMDEVRDWSEAASLGIARAIALRHLDLTPREEAHLAATIVREARISKLDPARVAAVIQVESGFRRGAVSPVGAVGLMQVMPGTAAALESTDPADAGAARDRLSDMDRNVRLGCRYLAAMRDRFGAIDRALLAYNMGPTAARAALRGPRAKALLAGYPRAVERARRQIVGDHGPRERAGAAMAELDRSRSNR